MPFPEFPQLPVTVNHVGLVLFVRFIVLAAFKDGLDMMDEYQRRAKRWRRRGS
jgi:hypothetical protein